MHLPSRNTLQFHTSADIDNSTFIIILIAVITIVKNKWLENNYNF